MTPSTPSMICFGIACVFSLVYGKVSEDHPLKEIPFVIFTAFFVFGCNL